MRKTRKRSLPLHVQSRGGKKKKLKSQTRGWNDLPHELEEIILSRLSLVELAGVSYTRKSFQAAFRKNLAVQQKALFDLAVARYGREQTTAFTDLVNGCLAEGIDDEGVAETSAPVGIRRLHPATSTEPAPIDKNTVFVIAKNPILKTWVRRNGRVRRRSGLNFAYVDVGEKELGWIIMLQALLSEDVFSRVRDGVAVGISTFVPESLLTHAWVKANAAPLMPLLEKCVLECNGQKIITKARMHARQRGISKSKALGLFMR